MDINAGPAQPIVTQDNRAIITFADWQYALSGGSCETEKRPALPTFMLHQPQNFQAVAAPALNDARITGGISQIQHLSIGAIRRVKRHVCNAQSQQSFAGIAILLILLVWVL